MSVRPVLRRRGLLARLVVDPESAAGVAVNFDIVDHGAGPPRFQPQAEQQPFPAGFVPILELVAGMQTVRLLVNAASPGSN